MTAFTKETLIIEGKYIYFAPQGHDTRYGDRKFVCRFRTAGVGTFATHLRKRWTPEAYFAEYDAGTSPLKIVEKTGYVLPHVKKELKRRGYPTTPTGFKQMVSDDVAKWHVEQAAQY
jgi:hypothetical protein|tara:strand:+ start:541 stop:891 length:351 start_codon:yes stop_codon:yes gene_type:complete